MLATMTLLYFLHTDRGRRDSLLRSLKLKLNATLIRFFTLQSRESHSNNANGQLQITFPYPEHNTFASWATNKPFFFLISQRQMKAGSRAST